MAEKKHTSTHYEKELRDIREGLLYLGALVEKAIDQAVRSLVERDTELASEVICDDAIIDQRDVEIEEKCIRVLALRQPTARDLRFITTAIKINGHLERIGDMAAKIAEKAIILNEEPPLKPYIDIPRMAEQTVDMLQRSLDAFIDRDAGTAKKIAAEDDLVDNLYDQVFRELLTFMAEDPKTITRATRLIWVAHNLERAADRVTNICERVVFIVTGKMEEMGASKY